MTFPPPADTPDRRRPARLAAAAPGGVRAAAAWSAAAAVAHGIRYLALVWFAERVAPWWVEAFTTALVWVTGTLAIAVGAAAAVAAAAWLVDARRFAYRPGRDPRRPAAIVLGCLVVVLNLVRLPVYLEELRRISPQGPTRARLGRWWGSLGASYLAVTTALWRGSADGPQAEADTVLLTALAAAVSVWLAWETLTVIRSFSGPPAGFTRRFIPAGSLATSPSRKG